MNFAVAGYGFAEFLAESRIGGRHLICFFRRIKSPVQYVTIGTVLGNFHAIAPLRFLAVEPLPEAALVRLATIAATPRRELFPLYMVLRRLILILIMFRNKT